MCTVCVVMWFEEGRKKAELVSLQDASECRRLFLLRLFIIPHRGQINHRASSRCPIWRVALFIFCFVLVRARLYRFGREAVLRPNKLRWIIVDRGPRLFTNPVRPSEFLHLLLFLLADSMERVAYFQNSTCFGAVFIFKLCQKTAAHRQIFMNCRIGKNISFDCILADEIPIFSLAVD